MSRATTRSPAQNSLTLWVTAVILCGCLISLLTFGLRSSFGLFNEPISATFGWSREVFAVSMAIQNLAWGIGQPIGGALADRFGSARILVAGGMLYAVGLALMAFSDSPATMHLTAGVLVGLGMGGASYIIVLAALAKIVSPERRSWALGLGTAAGSLGQFLVVPLGQSFIAAYGWQTAALLLAAMAAVVPLLASAFAGASEDTQQQNEVEISFGKTLSIAFRHPSYILLLAGFFVCGFQLAFVTIHMPPYLTDNGIDGTTAAWAIGIIGLFNIFGAYLSGIIAAGGGKKTVLAALYLGRALVTAAFVMLPLTPVSLMLFSAAMGLLWLSTVPPTSGLIAVMFGTRYMATLFGLVFLNHQLGSFLGVLLGGWLFDQTGSYDVAWWTCILLAVLAALVHLPIAERRAPQMSAGTP